MLYVKTGRVSVCNNLYIGKTYNEHENKQNKNTRKFEIVVSVIKDDVIDTTGGWS